MRVMHSCAKWENEQFASTNISGALLSGEIVWRGGKNYYANFTFGIASLSENPNEKNICLYSFESLSLLIAADGGIDPIEFETIARKTLDYLKIDGEITRMLCYDEKSIQFVSILSSWCNTQKTQVIAEYVENSEIQKNIENMGISYSQGYLFSKPQPWQNF